MPTTPVLNNMQRRQFGKWAGVTPLVLAKPAYAGDLLQRASDMALRLNPLIQPQERIEKRLYQNNNNKKVKWDTTLCKAKYASPPNDTYKVRAVFLEAHATDNAVYTIGPPLVRRDVQWTSKSGFYLFFSVLISAIRLPMDRPKELVDTTAKYFDCLDSRGEASNLDIPMLNRNFDFRKIKIVEESHGYYPVDEVYHELVDGGYPINAPALFRPVQALNGTFKSAHSVLEKILIFDIPLRPLRFKVELPPLIIQDVEVPMPTCFFEPFNIQTNRWVDG